MFIEAANNNGKKYLRLVESISVVVNGKRTSKKKTIYNIGPLEKFDDGKENYLERLKQSFKDGNPIIPALKNYLDIKPVRSEYDIHLFEGDPDCIGHSKLFSNALIEQILVDLGVISVVNKYKEFTNYQFDLLGFFRTLIYGRILNPASKIATIEQKDNYYNEVLTSNYAYNVYDTLDFVNTYKCQLLNRINNKLIEKYHRTTNVIYYDVTNFFFETEEPDEDTEDEQGLRKYGVSKEERHLPIVQMGLFLDEQGLPISIEVFPGNTLDHQTVITALDKSIDKLKTDRYIFVGDRGMYRGNNSYYITQKNNGYIVSKSIDKTAKEEKEWIFKKEGYIEKSPSFKYKSQVIKRKVKIGDELKEIVEKVVVFWSKNFYDRQIHENKSFLDFIDELEKNPNNFRITKTQKNSIRRFLKNDIENVKTGEILNSKDLKSYIDFDKINKYKEQFGYYQIVTSEENMPDLEVIDKYHGLSRIEDQFRIMKGNLDSRPVFVRTKEHIESHLVICLLGLLVVRIIQNKIVEYKKTKNETNSDRNWEMGLNGEKLQAALNKWKVAEITNGLYRFYDVDDKDLKLVLDAFGIKIENKLYMRNELRALKASIKVS